MSGSNNTIGILNQEQVVAINNKYYDGSLTESNIFNTQAEFNTGIRNDFSKCIFNFDIDIKSQIEITQQGQELSFEKSTFIGSVKAMGTTCECSLNFDNATFLEKKNHNSENDEMATIGDPVASTYEDSDQCIDFRGSTFKRRVSFNRVNSNIPISFNPIKYKSGQKIGTTFNGEVTFQSSTFKELGFIGATFNTKADFRDNSKNKAVFTVDFENAIFNNNVLFYNRLFNGYECFLNTKFNKLVDFAGCTFQNDTRFYKTDFFDTCVFSEATFEGKAVFQFSKIAQNVILRNAIFTKGLNFAEANFLKDGSLNTFNLQVEDFDCKVQRMNNEDWCSITYQEKRETFRILKNAALKENNRIEALKYHSQEMASHEKELRYGTNQTKKPIKMSNKRICEWYESIIIKLRASEFCCLKSLLFFCLRPLRFLLKLLLFDISCDNSTSKDNDKLILFFSRWSSKFSSSWIRGVSFTLWTGVIFFLVYQAALLSLHFDFSIKGVKFFWDVTLANVKYLPHIYNPTHSYKYMETVSVNYEGWTLVIDSLSRIFVGLGIYQTIQAFRKYGRF